MANREKLRERAIRGGAYVLGVSGDLARQGAVRLRAQQGEEDLEGDRWVEWSFCLARLAEGQGTTLDFGADIGFLALGAAQRGHEATAFDRLPSELDYGHPRVHPVQGDILTHDFGGARFDQIINCSSVEHVGLGGRYGSGENPEGDLQAMEALRGLLAEGGRMILTVPVGRDQVCAPLHRIYGQDRLPRLLAGYQVQEEQYWARRDGLWTQVPRDHALDVQGSSRFYALGLFVLTAQ